MCRTGRGSGRVDFVGAGPADDLITVRGARRIADADVVVWSAAAMSPAAVREHARDGAELADGTRWTFEQTLEVYRRAAAQRLAVVRIVPGDASAWAGLGRHHEACRRLGLAAEVVPGVAPLSAVVAATGRELAEPAVLTASLDAEPEVFAAAAGHGAVAVTASASRVEALVATLRASGRADDTEVVVGHRAGRADGAVVTTTLGEVEGVVKRLRLWLPAVFLVGRSPARSVVRHPVVPAATPYRRRRRAGAGDSGDAARSGPGGRVTAARGAVTSRTAP